MKPEKDPLVQLIEASLDAEVGATELADSAHYSVAHTYRLFERSGIGTPMRVLRRLRLERSAWELTHSERAVTEIAFDAGYESLEGYSRAFSATYGVSPSAYRRYSPSDYRTGLAGLHFVPAPSPLDRRQGALTLTLLDSLLDEHVRNVNRALDVYANLTEEQRNAIIPNASPFPWEPNDLTLAQLVTRNCGFGEPWIHMLDDEPESRSDGTIDGLRALLHENDRRFRNLVRQVEREGSWDLTFVDAECDPPQVFTYGLVANMQIVYTSHERVVLEHHLRQLGHPITFV